jgi:CubicO group peptidase (beta-lactamase class C family)
MARLQMVEKERLALDDALALHLPDYPNQEFAPQVTIRHVLTHTGGTGDIFAEEHRASGGGSGMGAARHFSERLPLDEQSLSHGAGHPRRGESNDR